MEGLHKWLIAAALVARHVVVPLLVALTGALLDGAVLDGQVSEVGQHLAQSASK